MEDSEHKKLFVGGISWETSEDVLKEYFSKYGNVVGCAIAKDRTTGNPRGFAFVSFSEPAALDEALVHHIHHILGRTVEVKKAIPRGEQQQQSRGFNRNSRGSGRGDDYFRTKKIFVGGLSANLTEEEFKGYFESFGSITDVVVMHDNVTHRPRGFGFITFESEDSVEAVMQKSFHELSGKLVEVKRAIPKEGNANGNSFVNARLGGGRGSNYNSYQPGNYPPYNSQYGLLPAYGPLSGYGGIAGYPYGPGIYGGGYPSGGFGGIGYGMAPLAPRSPWNSPAMVGFHGSPMPYGAAPQMYPYMNGGVGLVGVASNGYHGSGDAQGGAGSMPSRNGIENVDVNSLGPSGSFGGDASKQDRKGSGKSS